MTATELDTDRPRTPAWPVSAAPAAATGGRTPPRSDGPPAVADRGGRLAFRVPLAADITALTAALAVSHVGWFGLIYALGVLLVLAADGQHRLRICLRLADQLPRLLVAAAVPLLLVPVLPASGGAADDLRLAAMSVGLLVLCRAGVYAAMRAARRRGLATQPTLIVGSGPVAQRIAGLLRDHPEFGAVPVGFADNASPHGGLPLPVLGRPAALRTLVARHRIRRVIVCDAMTPDDDLVDAVRVSRPLPADVCVVPRLWELGAAVPRACLDDVWGVPLIPLRRLPFTTLAMRVKRGFDVIVAAPLLLVLSPLLAVLGMAVACGQERSVLFWQSRVTRDGVLAPIVKFRTVRDRRHSETSWAVPAEHCTRLGQWLRATHLDELPQLVNVLRGDMSLVGPRPERPFFASKFAREIPRYDDRHRVLGGMTGWAQVHGLHGDTSIPDRARFDNQYIEYWSPWLDLVILWRTLMTVLRGVTPLPSHPLSPDPLPVHPRAANHVTQGGRT